MNKKIKSKQTKKILFLASSPKDSKSKRFDEELRVISEAIKRSNNRCNFEIESELAVGVNQFRQALLKNPQIVHFSGFSNEDGLLFHDSQEQSFKINSEALADLFKLCEETVECVILNAHYSEKQAKLISTHIGYVIGIKQEISDQASIKFSEGFYDALGSGRPYYEAFEIGCNAISMCNLPNHDAPILFKNGKKIKKDVSKDTLSVSSKIGIYSFHSEYSSGINEKEAQTCSLCDAFEGRYLVHATWEDLKQKIKNFLFETIIAGNSYEFYLSLHTSLAFFTGRELHIKSGVDAGVFQPSIQTVWRIPKEFEFKNDINWNVQEISTFNAGNEIAVAFSITQYILPDVEFYVRKELPQISHILHISLNDHHNLRIKNAAQSYEASYKAVEYIKEKHKQVGSNRLHLFISGPNAFTFMLGQLSLPLSNITLYEYEFGTNKPGGYIPSIII